MHLPAMTKKNKKNDCCLVIERLLFWIFKKEGNKQKRLLALANVHRIERFVWPDER